MRLGVVSDSHGHVPCTQAAVRMLESLDVDLVVHCGDVGSPDIIGLFAKWPTHFVFGNVDDDLAELETAANAAGQHWHGAKGEIAVAGRRIAWLHGHDHELFRATVRGGEFDLVCYGHTHRSEWHDQRSTRVLNPGALYRANPHSLAVVDLADLQPVIVPL